MSPPNARALITLVLCLLSGLMAQSPQPTSEDAADAEKRQAKLEAELGMSPASLQLGEVFSESR